MDKIDMFEYQFKYSSVVRTILPDNKTTQKNREKQALKEKLLQEKKERALQEKQDQELKARRMQEKHEKEKKELEAKQRADELRKQEELQQINTLKGKFGGMINSLKKNDTSLDYTITGLDLRQAQIRILAKAVETNQSLKGLTLCRKKIDDDNGVVIVNYLKNNFVLERLELEGNSLGPKTSQAFGELFFNNQSIRFLDLENNDLTNSGQNLEGIKHMAKSLENNECLLYLNLTNTKLNAECGDYLERMLQKNQTIIMMDVGQNSQLKINQVRQIQEYLKRNKRAYDDERYKEFIERKKMWNEMNISKDLQLQKESKQLLQMNLNTRIETKKQENEENWTRDLEILEIKRQKEILKLEKESKLKKGKKKKRGKKAK